jgi:hypothetical protein
MEFSPVASFFSSKRPHRKLTQKVLRLTEIRGMRFGVGRVEQTEVCALIQARTKHFA